MAGSNLKLLQLRETEEDYKQSETSSQEESDEEDENVVEAVRFVVPETVPPKTQNLRWTNQLKFLQDVVVKPIMKHKYAWPFMAPVDAQKLNIPDYYVVIKNPMDFGTIKERLQNKFYHKADECLADLTAVFTNCYAYNRADPPPDIVGMAKTLEAFFCDKLRSMPAEEFDITVPRRGRKKGAGSAGKISSIDGDEVDTPPTTSTRRSTRSRSTTSSTLTTIQFHDVSPNRSLRASYSSVSLTPLGHSSASAATPKRLRKRSSCSSDGGSVQSAKEKHKPTPVKTGRKRKATLPAAPSDYNKKSALLKEMERCQAILRALMSPMMNEYAWPFRNPVDPVRLNLNDYFDVIKQPMDLTTIQEKLQRNEYSNQDEFAEDIRLIAQNCFTYNPPTHELVLLAAKFQSTFERMLVQVISIPNMVEDNKKESDPTSEDENEMNGIQEQDLQKGRDQQVSSSGSSVTKPFIINIPKDTDTTEGTNTPYMRVPVIIPLRRSPPGANHNAAEVQQIRNPAGQEFKTFFP